MAEWRRRAILKDLIAPLREIFLPHASRKNHQISQKPPAKPEVSD
jgi:hypothetical protein